MQWPHAIVGQLGQPIIFTRDGRLKKKKKKKNMNLLGYTYKNIQ